MQEFLGISRITTKTTTRNQNTKKFKKCLDFFSNKVKDAQYLHLSEDENIIIDKNF